MGKYKNKAYSLRIDNDLMEKIRTIAEREDRAINKQIERMLRTEVEDYEKDHGAINVKNINITNNSGDIHM